MNDTTTTSRCALAACSLPVTASEILRVVEALENNAQTRETVLSIRKEKDTWEERVAREAASLRYCAMVLRRHSTYVSRQIEHDTPRQPEENTETSQPRGQTHG